MSPHAGAPGDTEHKAPPCGPVAALPWDGALGHRVRRPVSLCFEVYGVGHLLFLLYQVLKKYSKSPPIQIYQVLLLRGLDFMIVCSFCALLISKRRIGLFVMGILLPAIACSDLLLDFSKLDIVFCLVMGQIMLQLGCNESNSVFGSVLQCDVLREAKMFSGRYFLVSTEHPGAVGSCNIYIYNICNVSRSCNEAEWVCGCGFHLLVALQCRFAGGGAERHQAPHSREQGPWGQMGVCRML